MRDFAFKVNLVLRAADENVARKIVPDVLGVARRCGNRTANQNNAAIGRDATITDVDFSVGPIKLVNGGSDLGGTEAAPVRAASVRRK
jgi:hypothetical protein